MDAVQSGPFSGSRFSGVVGFGAAQQFGVLRKVMHDWLADLQSRANLRMSVGSASEALIGAC